MHRTKTRFAARVNHVATALEGAVCGPRTRSTTARSLEPEEPKALGRTPGARRRPAASPRRARRRRLLAPDVRGASSGNGAWSEIESQAARFVADTEAALAGDREGLACGPGRSSSFVSTATARRSGSTTRGFVRAPRTDARPREHLPRVVVEARVRRHVVLRPASCRRGESRVTALAPGLQRQAPPEGVPLPRRRRRGHWAVPVRAWSAPGGRHGDAWPWRPLGENYPPESELEQRLPAEDFKTFTGPKGTLLFCNTSASTAAASRP